VESLRRVVLDTSAYSAFNRGDARLLAWFQPEVEILVPLIVLGELHAGFAAGKQSKENEALLRRFLDSPVVSLLPLTANTTEHFASLFLALRKSGVAVSTNGLWIAALAKEHTLPILTVDDDFSRIPGVSVVPI